MGATSGTGVLKSPEPTDQEKMDFYEEMFNNSNEYEEWGGQWSFVEKSWKVKYNIEEKYMMDYTPREKDQRKG